MIEQFLHKKRNQPNLSKQVSRLQAYSYLSSDYLRKLASINNKNPLSRHPLSTQLALIAMISITASAVLAKSQPEELNQNNPESAKINAVSKPLVTVQPMAEGLSAVEIDNLVRQADDYKAKGNYAAAVLIWEKLLAIHEKIFGFNHPETATCLNDLAALYDDQGYYNKAEPLYTRALEIREKALGVDHPDTASILNNLAVLYFNKGLYGKAEPLFIRALAINKDKLGPDHKATATNLNNLASMYNTKGLYEKAEPLFKRTLAIREKALGPDHPETATSLNNLADLYQNQGLYNKAEPLLIRALAINEKLHGPDHPATGLNLNNLASLYHTQGFHSKAEPYFIRALSISEKALGSDHPETSKRINNLASLYVDQGFYSKAEPLYLRALSISEKTLGPDHPDTSIRLNNLASLYVDQGFYSKAEPLYFRALSISEKKLGPDNPDLAKKLNQLGLLYQYQGLYRKAERLIIHALSITEKALGHEHAETSIVLNNLANLYILQGHYPKAEQLFVRSISIAEKAFGVDHPMTSKYLNNLALAYEKQGLYRKAEQLYIRSIRFSKNKLGPDHPQTVTSLTNLSELYRAAGLQKMQILTLSKSIKSQNLWLTREMPMMPQKDRSQFLNNASKSWTVPYELANQHSSASNLALSTRLNRQGILQEIERRQSLLLHAPGWQKELASQLGALNTQLASVSNNSNQRQAIRTERDQLEAQLYRLMPDLQLKEVSPAQVSAVLPSESVLVEFQRYQPYDYKIKKPNDQRWRDPQYLALILKPNGSIKAVPLGPAKPIDTAITKALASTQEALADSQTNWELVSRLVFDPLKPQLKGSRHWFLSPDAELTRIPFLALPASIPGQRFLSDDLRISVLTTGRDLLRLQEQPVTSEKAVVIVNPSYSLKTATGSVSNSDLSDQPGQRRSAELGSKTWQPLPQTQPEGEEIAKLLSVPLISKDQATTNLLQTIHGPKVLHVATHGFFQPNQETTPPDLLRTIGSDHQLLRGLKTEEPMLRSGLVLAGANNPMANPADDGYLTAAEATGLQLDGTELVVLSACSTGQGESKTGEGLYGLQRALTVAGARSTLLSLWKVDDEATRAFMVRYYTLLKEGKGRGEALVQVQREYRTDPAYKAKNWDHHYYWAAWQLTGDWKPIQGL